jgi:hypothetical protein
MTTTGAQAKVQRMQTRFLMRRANHAGLPSSEAWRLSQLELWLHDEVIVKIVEINLVRSYNDLMTRLAVARLPSVCKAWDAALLPLFHPGVPGVISPVELRKLKWLALDQTDRADPASVGNDDSRSQRGARRGFVLPEGMLAATGPEPQVRSALTEALWSRVRDSLVKDYEDILHGAPAVNHYVFFDHLHYLLLPEGCTDERLSLFLRSDLYDNGCSRSCKMLDNDVMPHFTNTVCLAYRILMVIKVVEARAIALSECPVSRELPLDSLRTEGRAAEVPLNGWRVPSPAGMLAQLAWDVHRESGESYCEMSRSLLAGSGAVSLSSPTTDSQDLLLRSFNLPQLEAAHFPQGVAQDLVRKARQLFPLAFPDTGSPRPYTCMVLGGERRLKSCFSSRMRHFLCPSYSVSDLQAALGSTMHDLLGDEKTEAEEDDEEGAYHSDDSYSDGYGSDVSMYEAYWISHDGNWIMPPPFQM